MSYHRQKDHQVSKLRDRLDTWQAVFKLISKRRLQGLKSSFTQTTTLIGIAEKLKHLKTEYSRLIGRSNRISTSSFAFNFNSFSDSECLRQFRFRKADIVKLINALGLDDNYWSTSRNRYMTSGLLTTCVILKRLSSPMNWADLEIMFGKHSSQLSEIFWEGVESVMNKRGHLLRETVLSSAFFQSRFDFYAGAIYAKGGALKHCVGLIDGTVIGISRPSGGYMQQLVAYNGHKKKHALKFQVISAPDGLVLHCYGPMEGRRHDWTLYAKSMVDDLLESSLSLNGKQYCIFGDSGYNSRSFLKTPWEGSNLSVSKHAFNKAMSTVRIPVEWVFKDIKQYFPLMDFIRKLKVNQAPVASMYMISILLYNFRTCLYGNPTSGYFTCVPPTLEEYISCHN